MASEEEYRLRSLTLTADNSNANSPSQPAVWVIAVSTSGVPSAWAINIATILTTNSPTRIEQVIIQKTCLPLRQKRPMSAADTAPTIQPPATTVAAKPMLSGSPLGAENISSTGLYCQIKSRAIQPTTRKNSGTAKKAIQPRARKPHDTSNVMPMPASTEAQTNPSLPSKAKSRPRASIAFCTPNHPIKLTAINTPISADPI